MRPSLSCKSCKIPRMVSYCVPRSVPELRLPMLCVRSLLRRAGMMSVLLQRPTTAIAYALSRVRWPSAAWSPQGLMPKAVKGLILRPRATLCGSAGRKGSVVQASPTLLSSEGAIKTRTRRFWGRSALFCECPCGHPVCSARRLFQECPRLSQVRCSLQQQHGLRPSFWTSVPRCTSKTGWITLDASPDALTRVRMQIASCELGLCIVPLAEEVPDAS